MTGPALRILQFGAGGQLATELLKVASPDFVLTQLGEGAADFLKPEQVRTAVLAADRPDIVVNAAAYTAVDRAESEEDAALTINADAVGAMAEACETRKLPLIHVSTDYVFDGEKPAPYVEDDPVGPINAYGRTKCAGEELLRKIWDRHVIVRTSWVYSAHGSNFVRTMLRLGRERKVLRVVDDQWGAPTSARDLAAAILSIAKAIGDRPGERSFGTFHYCGGGFTTWRHFAEAIFASVVSRGGEIPAVQPITSAEYPTPARRPRNSRLDCSKIAAVYGISPVPWHDALERVLAELAADPEGRVA